MELNLQNRNVYVVSDIHNEADSFKELLQQINFSPDDYLIIAGDLFDRGDKPLELYFEILKHPNIYVIQGNHDIWVKREIFEKYSGKEEGEYISYNTVSILEKRLTPVDMVKLAEWIDRQPYYINLILNEMKYQIAHAQTYPTPERLWDKSKLYMGDAYYEEFLHGRDERGKNFISVVGHTATETRKIWRSETGKTIRIDCGAGYMHSCEFGQLGMLRLNDGKEFYTG